MKKRKPVQNLVWVLCLLAWLTHIGWLMCLSFLIGMIVHAVLMKRAEKGSRLPYAVVIVFFTVCLSFLVSKGVLKRSADLTGPTDLFIDVCDQLFAEGPDSTATDRDGNDVTERFLREYQEAYHSGDYVTLWDAVAEEAITISFTPD